MRIGLVSKWGEKIKMLKVSDEFVKVVLEKIVILLIELSFVALLFIICAVDVYMKVEKCHILLLIIIQVISICIYAWYMICGFMGELRGHNTVFLLFTLFLSNFKTRYITNFRAVCLMFAAFILLRLLALFFIYLHNKLVGVD